MEGWDGAKGEVFDEMRTRLGRVMVAVYESCTRRVLIVQIAEQKG